MKYLKTFILLLNTVYVFCQIELKEKVVLNGNDSLDRTVIGIAFPESSFNAANASSLLTGNLIFAPATGINFLTINLLPIITTYTPGMILNFKISSPNTGPVFLQVNALPPIELKKNGTTSLDSADFYSGEMISAIFDGTYFQLLSKLSKRCPSGYVEVNKNFCIEKDERNVVNWFDATKTCGNMGARLCTQAEWAYACQKASIINLSNMLDNWEWIDSAGNAQDQCKSMGKNSAGEPGCNQGYTFIWSSLRPFRCCYSK